MKVRPLVPEALLSNTTGQHNTGLGTFALFTNSTGQFNNSVGANSLLFNVDRRQQQRPWRKRAF